MQDKISKIHVNTSKSYDVIIGRNILKSSGEIVGSLLPKCKIALITDDIVDGLYADSVTSSIQDAGFDVVKFVFKNGEQSKNLTTYGDMLNFLAENEFTRTDAVVALGGGVVGDMAGFTAATYLRGIKYIQIPTTLLAQIDSSVGGKTAIDLPGGKNLVGAFCQPLVVIIDVSVIDNLPLDTYIGGMGELAKYAVLDKRIFEQVNKSELDMEKLVYLCVDYKRMIVEQDEFENGNRRLLNLGHTPAHGIEKLSGYEIPHGRAVAMGLEIILNASFKRGFIDEKTYLAIRETIQKCVKARSGMAFSLEDIVSASYSDKKRSGEYITLVMIYGVGDCRPVKIKVSELKEYLS